MKNKKILITGATGFIGKNLTATLLQAGYTNLYLYDRANTQAQLERYCTDADFVFHLAGVNRPQDPKEFYEGNTEEKTLHQYNSHNTERLDIAGTIAKMKTTDYIKEELAKLGK